MAKVLVEMEDGLYEDIKACRYQVNSLEDYLNDMASVITDGTEIKKAKWIDSPDWKERAYDSKNFRKHCSICHGTGYASMKFCPTCGAEIEENTDETSTDTDESKSNKIMIEMIRKLTDLYEITLEWGCNDRAKSLFANAIYACMHPEKDYYQECIDEFKEYMLNALKS